MEPRYLGDGVYATFDGHHVWLHLGAHDAPALVALEVDVFVALTRYGNKAFGLQPKGE